MIAAADEYWMAVALRAGRSGSPAPNPHVGAVVVANDELVAIGWHERAGDPHAEVLALRAAGVRARGATLYVTLEPRGRLPRGGDRPRRRRLRGSQP
jgi:diaminohydroxyphosphoribosylaminopyrimidine deaminase/5-amino-6-(5-phosphoribosylamino)uracil reductase